MSLQKRLRLYGKPASKLEIAKEIANLLLGSEKAHREPKNVSEVTRALGFATRQTIYTYINIAEKNGFLKFNDEGKVIKPEKSQAAQFKEFTENHPILSDPLVEKWYQKLCSRRKHTGLVIANKLVNIIERICNTCKCHPQEIIESKESAERLKNAYVELYKQHLDWKKTKKNLTHGNIENLDYQASYAIASFCAVYGISWERGTAEMSRKITGHGKYPDVRLTKNEFEEADRFIKEKWGLDSDAYRWFWIGVESCSRFKALYTMKLEYDIHTSKTGKKTYLMTVYESKTKHIKDGKWLKYIRREDSQKSIDLLKSRGATRIYESKHKGKFKNYIGNLMKEIFSHLGKEGIFLKRPTHVLRHIGAHYALAKGNYTNHVLVAKIGGWHTVDEMIKSYGELPPEKILEELDKYV